MSVSVDRLEESSCGGSMLLGATPVRRSQFVKPGSVEPALTCGSCMSAPDDGARLSGTQAVDDVGATLAEGRAWGVKAADECDDVVSCVCVRVDEWVARVVVDFVMTGALVVCVA